MPEPVSAGDPVPAVSEGIVLNILEGGQADALFREKLIRLLQKPHTVQIVVNQAAYKKLHGQIGGFAAGETFLFLFRPDRSNGIHGSTGYGVVQLHGGSILQFPVRLGHQALLCIFDQLFCVHHGGYLLFVSEFSLLHFTERSTVRAPGFIRQSQFPPTVPG